MSQASMPLISALLQRERGRYSEQAPLKRDAVAEARAIRVTIQGGGTVKLEGKVDNWRKRMAVKAAAWSAPGVRGVIDELAIA